MRYLLGSGYFHPAPDTDAFVELWAANLLRHTQPMPERVVILSVGRSWGAAQASATASIPNLDVVMLDGNCGHVHQLIGKQQPAKPHAYCGWSASVLALALIAYNAEADLVYREQDALCFGDYVGEMYRQIGGGEMIFGNYIENGQHRMPCAQSLFLVRHSFIPTFVSTYLSLADDRSVRMLPEQKFANIAMALGPKAVRRFTFGVDRGRPLPYGAPVWYAQKLTAHELAELRARGLL